MVCRYSSWTGTSPALCHQCVGLLFVCLFVCFCLQFGLQGFLVFFFGLQFSVTRVLFVYSCVTEVLFVVYCFCLHFLFMVWHHAIVSPLGWFECCVASS